MIVGHGNVGSAVASLFEDHEKVIIDPKINSHKIEHYSKIKFEAIFVCVDTPKGQNTTILDAVLSQIDEHIGHQTPVCCKCTSTPSYYTWAKDHYTRIKVLHSPEYLSSNRNLLEEFQNQKFLIVGGDKDAGHTITKIFIERLRSLTKDNVYITDITTAALIKYAENFFLGFKVTLFNELFEIHQRLECQSTFEEFRLMLGADSRIGRSHTQVPGWDGKFGWGGHCLDKDNYEFMQFSESPLVEFIYQLNIIHRQKDSQKSNQKPHIKPKK